MRIKISKRAEVTGGLPAELMQDHIPGTPPKEGYSIPVDYTIEGELVTGIVVGQIVYVLRDKRNGVSCEGFFQTSPVTEVTEKSFSTKNSVYDYEFLLTNNPDEVSLSV